MYAKVYLRAKRHCTSNILLDMGWAKCYNGLSFMESKTFTANVEVKDIPTEANRIINALCKLDGKPKWKHIRQAIIDYAEKHRSTAIRLLGGDRT